MARRRRRIRRGDRPQKKNRRAAGKTYVLRIVDINGGEQRPPELPAHGPVKTRMRSNTPRHHPHGDGGALKLAPNMRPTMGRSTDDWISKSTREEHEQHATPAHENRGDANAPAHETASAPVRKDAPGWGGNKRSNATCP